MKKMTTWLGAAACVAAAGLWIAVPSWGGASGQPDTRERKERPARNADSRANSPRRANKPAKAPVQAADGKQLYGWAYNNEYSAVLGWDDFGPVAIDTDGMHTLVNNPGFKSFNGCYIGDGKYFGAEDTNGNVKWQIFDTTDWSVLSSVTYTPNSPDVLPYGLTWDPETRNVYGCFYESSTTWWGTPDAHFCLVNLDDPFNPTTLIGDLGKRMRAITAAADGTIYGIGYDGNLYTINKSTAALTEVGALELHGSDMGGYDSDPWSPWTQGVESAVTDWETGLIYLFYNDSEGDTFIVTIDPETQATDYIADFGYWSGGTETTEVFSGLWFVQEPAAKAQGTPVAVADMVAAPKGVEHTLTLAFTMPSEDTDGEALEGDLTWSLSDGTSDIATGTAAAGSEVDTEVGVPQTGRYNLSLRTAAGDNVSDPATASIWVGPDTPVIAGTPTTLVSTDKTSVTILLPEPWAKEGGNLARPIAYRITRLPEGEVIEENATLPSYTDTPADPAKRRVQYTVTPKAGDVEGEALTTREHIIGDHWAIPHYNDFTDEAYFNAFGALDANNDGNTWWWSSTYKAATYSSGQNPPDDYLLVGPFDLTAGDKYNFAMTADGHDRGEKVAVYAGTDPTSAASFATEVIGVTQVFPWNGHSRLSGAFIPTESGKYWFGIKACSPTDGKNLYIFDVQLTAMSRNCPAAPADMALASTQNTIKVTCTLPSTTIAGDDTELTAVRVYRGGEMIFEKTEGLTPGATFEYEDTAAPQGAVTYTVTATNAQGEGEAATRNGWCGLDVPGGVHNVRIFEDLETPGLMHVTWTPPTGGLNGGWVDTANINYYIEWSIFQGEAGTATTAGECEATIQLPAPAKQGLLSCSVYAANSIGSGRSAWNTQSGYFGPALPLPLRESWADGTQRSGYWSGQSLVEFPELFESFWDINSGVITGKTPQDNDGGMLLCSTTVDGRGQRTRAPRIDISKAAKPTLTFWYLYTDNCLEYNVEIAVDDQPYSVIKSLDLDAAEAGKWIRAEIDLSAYKDAKYMQLAWTARAVKAGDEFAALDNVAVADMRDADIAVESLTGPSKVTVNEEAAFTARLRNNGRTAVAADAYSVTARVNGKDLKAVETKEIPAEGTVELTFADIPGVFADAVHDYDITVAYEGDEDPANNTSAPVSVTVVQHPHPAVTGLKAEQTHEGVRLSWDDPCDGEMPGAQTVESFEGYDNFAIDGIGKWTVRDIDDCPTVILATALGTIEFPHVGQHFAWMVFNPDEAGVFFNAWMAPGGEKYLISFQACRNEERNVASEDWLISPELNGEAQRISFVANAGMSAYAPETFDILVSSTGTDNADFTVLAADVDVPYSAGDWTDFSYDLPEGTKYFAIVHKTFGGIALMIDNVTFTEAGAAPAELNLTGFNVYRNRELITAEPVSEFGHTDTAVQIGDTHTYHVTAVWDKGESVVSDPVTVTLASASGLGHDTVRVIPGAGMITVKGGSGQAVRLYTTDGILVATAQAEGTLTLDTRRAGVYVLTVGDKTFKVNVK